MMQNVNSVLIGKNIARTGSTTTLNLAEGEMIWFDENKKMVTTALTAANKVAYLGVGTKDTTTVISPDGTTSTTYRVIRFSAPIVGANIKKVTGRAYTAAAEQVDTITFSLTPVAGTEYTIRIVYKDLYQHKGQFTYTYRYIAVTGDTSATMATAFGKLINKHKDARVSASVSDAALTITAKVIPNSNREAIDEYRQVIFKTVLFSSNFGATSIANTTLPSKGFGTPKLVRDLEKHALSYIGISNRTWFPVVKPDLTTDMAATYNGIVIESEIEYQSPDNQYKKKTPVSTNIFLACGSQTTAGTANQSVTATNGVITNLNAWLTALGLDTVTITGWYVYNA